MTVVLVTLPPSLVSWRPTGCTPIVLKACVVVSVVPVSVANVPLPSKSHLTSVIEPLGTDEPVASNVMF